MGITEYNMVKFMIVTSIARIPSIITSTICGSALEKKSYALSAAVFITTAILGLIGIMIYNKLEAKFNKQLDDGKKDDGSDGQQLDKAAE